MSDVLPIRRSKEHNSVSEKKMPPEFVFILIALFLPPPNKVYCRLRLQFSSKDKMIRLLRVRLRIRLRVKTGS